MPGYLSLLLHAHMPFVRHPEHEYFLEENWLFEAITETYIPLIQVFEGWHRDAMRPRLTLTMTPTLCSMLLDPLLQSRYERHIEKLIELADREIHRTHWEAPVHALAWMYYHRFVQARETFHRYGRNMVGAFRRFQELGILEIITCAASHALLPLMAGSPQSLKAQIFTARDHYQECFGVEPKGIWLPECAYCEELEKPLQEANIRWFVLDSHGVLHANPRPRYGIYAPIFTPNGIAAFGRDLDSAKQVWSKHEGYPGDGNYRDFYRDIGFDLDLDYLRPYLPAPDLRTFTGIKYHRITGAATEKAIYDRDAALKTADLHATHFLQARLAQVRHLSEVLDRPPMLVCPYDAELFGHWWYEGPEFLNYLVRKAYYDQSDLTLITPSDYLHKHPTQQLAHPSASSWGEEGYLRVWLNESNEWIFPHLQVAQERMTGLARRFPNPTPLQERALKQAGRELLLAQASDWPFILRAGTSTDYARKRVKNHLLRFIGLHDQLTSTSIDESWLDRIEWMDNPFPNLNYRYWA